MNSPSPAQVAGLNAEKVIAYMHERMDDAFAAVKAVAADNVALVAAMYNVERDKQPSPPPVPAQAERLEPCPPADRDCVQTIDCEYPDCICPEGLKACPFCGSKAEIVSAEEAGESAYVVSCTNGMCMASSKVAYALKGDVSEQLTEAWNRRAPASAKEET